VTKVKKIRLLCAVVALVIAFVCHRFLPEKFGIYNEGIDAQSIEEVRETVGSFSGEPFIVINNNEPFFDSSPIDGAYEYYGDLDYLGRCTYTEACIGKEIMPTEKRGSISHIYPTGWEQEEYPFVDGKSLYNRCHLIGHQLTGEDDTRENLITGTRYMNVEGMLPFENMVADYINETKNHVMYRVTPVFKGDNLLASGVIMEAKSVEDNGRGICFNVYCYNAQPGVAIDYATGKSAEE